MIGPATEKQITFIKQLIAERSQFSEEDYHLNQLSKEQASKVIDDLLKAPKPKQEVSGDKQQPLLPGIYRVPTQTHAGFIIYKVQISKMGKHPYAKELKEITGNRLTETNEVVQFEYVYSPGAIKAIKPEHRLTLDQAQALGIKFGFCVVCGAFLKDAQSVKDGIGPVCKQSKLLLAKGWEAKDYSKPEHPPLQDATWKSYGVD